MKNSKKIIALTLLLLGLISIIYSFIASLYRVSFSGFFMLIGVTLIAFSLLKLFAKPVKSQVIKTLVKIFNILVILGLVFFFFIESLVIYSSLKKDITKPDYIVILGAGLWGETPSLTLIQRLDTSLSLIKLHPDVKIVVSGGKGPGETITEAEAMKKFLIGKDIDSNRIIMEDKSTNTLENLSNTHRVIKKIDSRKKITITIVTSDFHMFRSKFLANRVGFEAYGYPAPLLKYLVPAYHVREFFAVIKSYIFDLNISN
jgi:uncharacterized SAM-binding protein YcdF (DUF218 family)